MNSSAESTNGVREKPQTVSQSTAAIGWRGLGEMPVKPHASMIQTKPCAVIFKGE